MSAPTTSLRQAMIEAMRTRGFAPRTEESYLTAVRELARYYHRSPDRLEPQQLARFFVYLATQRGLSGASSRLYLNGVRFFYLQVLHWTRFDVPLAMPKKAQRIPELLTREEVARLLGSPPNAKHRMVLTLC